MQSESRRTPVASEAELDMLEHPVREAFRDFMRAGGILGTTEPVLGMTFTAGGVHFAAKALEFVPVGVTVVLVGALLDDAEISYLKTAGYLVFNYPLNFDNELMYELLMECTAGRFGWVDADCFVLDPALWGELLAEMDSGTSAHAAFTYEPLGFAKTPMVMWSSRVREPLEENRTTLNSYAPIVTNTGRISVYAISRLADERHLRILGDVLGREHEGSLSPHDGLLDIYSNGRTVNSRNREGAARWFGAEVKRSGWLIDTPILAEAVLRQRGMRTRRLSDGNRQLTNRVIHVGASGYRERMRKEGASEEYMSRFRLTDLLEVLLAQELERRGLSGRYAELSARQLEHLSREAGILAADVGGLARARLEQEGVHVPSLQDDPRMGFLF